MAKTTAEETELTPEQQHIKELERQLALAKDQLAQALRQNEGWLVTSPNILYDGSTAGVQFVNGVAFIGKDQKVPYYEAKREPDGAIRKRYAHLISGALTEDERKANIAFIQQEIAAQRKREAVSSAERAAEAMEAEWGYKVEYFSADRLAELQQRMGDRANQRRVAQAALQAQMNAEALVPPGYMGG